jgi:hypothetical protein
MNQGREDNKEGSRLNFLLKTMNEQASSEEFLSVMEFCSSKYQYNLRLVNKCFEKYNLAREQAFLSMRNLNNK